MGADVVDERRARRTFLVEPVELVLKRVTMVEHPFGSAPEDERIALAPDAESPDRDAVDALDADVERVPPGHVVRRAGGQDFDLAVPGEMFRDVPRVQLRAAVDRRAVALDDDRDLHWSVSASEGGAAGAADGSRSPGGSASD